MPVRRAKAWWGPVAGSSLSCLERGERFRGAPKGGYFLERGGYLRIAEMSVGGSVLRSLVAGLVPMSAIS